MSTLLEQDVQPQSNPTTTFIYGLVDPRTGYVRYVGKANRPTHRLAMHLTPGELRETSHKNSWLHGLLNEGKKPELIILEAVNRSVWQSAERAWIAYYRSIPGYPPLTNTTDGGEGVEGYVLSAEDRRKRSERQKGTRMSPSSRAKISAAHKGRKHTQTARKNMSEGRKDWWKNLPEEAQQRQMNVLHSYRKRHGTNHSQFTGVTLAHGGSWRASAFVNGKFRYIGQFKIEEEAARMRDSFVLQHVGEQVVLNFARSEYDASGNSLKSFRRPLTKANTSGYKGVHWHKQALKWQAGGYFSGRYISAGLFHDKIEAAKAYDRKVIELLDSLAYTNFPRSSYD
jgi:hypothetical protein